FLPLLAIAFVWMREIYGTASGWLAVALLALEPNLAAHIPTPALDVIGATGIVFSCWTMCRLVHRPSMSRLIIAAIAMAIALLLKNTAAILPPVAMVFVLLSWWKKRRDANRGAILSQEPSHFPSFARAVQIFVGVLLLAMWVLLLFDFSRPTMPHEWK